MSKQDTLYHAHSLSKVIQICNDYEKYGECSGDNKGHKMVVNGMIMVVA